MTTTDLDRRVIAWLEEPGDIAAPAHVIENALSTAAGRRQRRVWLPFLERDFPVQTSLRLVRAPSPIWLVLVALLIAFLGATILVGRTQVPKPFGLTPAGLIALDVGGDIVVQGADGSARRLLTTGASSDAFPVFSYDGTRVAFWRETDGVLSLVIAGLDSGSGPIAVELPPGAQRPPATLVAWSPSSDRIAFSIATTQPRSVARIWIVNADGTGLHQVGPFGDFAEDPAWAPDGASIAFHGGGDGSPQNGVYVMADDGSTVRRISVAPGSGYAFHSPVWQPDGALLAYYTGDDGKHDIYVANADGSSERALSTDPSDEYWPVWSPDGRFVAFDRNVASVDGAIHNVVVVVGPDGSDEIVLDPSADLGDAVSLDTAQVRWSPDGTRIAAFLADASRSGYALVTFDARTGQIRSQMPTNGASPLVSWQRRAP
jgi:Tol biopolymer transport system component